jgi:hypothetical protein
MASDILKQRDALLECVRALAKDIDTQLAPACGQLSSEVRQLNAKWQGLTDFYNWVRKFSHLLSWQSWYDWQTNGGKYWTPGHDVRLSLSQKYLSRQIERADIAKNIDWGALNAEVNLDDTPKVAFSETLADALQITFTGTIVKNSTAAKFSYRFHLGIFPAAEKSARVRIVKAGILMIEDAPGIDRAALQKDINALLRNYFLAQKIFDFDKLATQGLSAHSAHIDKQLSLFFSASLPQAPLQGVMGDIEPLPAPDAWEDMQFMVNDDYISRSMSQNVEGFGNFAYKEDPFNPGNYVFPFVTRVTIVRDSHVHLWFFKFNWHYEDTVWPEFWLRMKSDLRNDGNLDIRYQVSLASGNQPEAESTVFSLSDVEKVVPTTFKQKGFRFSFCFKQ